MKKIALACKLDPYGAYGFIKPISDISSVSRIDVFRDQDALKCKKVEYHTSKHKLSIFAQIHKLYKMIKLMTEDYTLAIGIYEIPHGMLAYIAGKLRNVPSVISIIGNPGYTQLRRGLRQLISNYMYKRAFAVTVTGSNSKNILIENGIDKEKIYILPNSIDIETFKPMQIEKKYDIVSLGRISEEKELGNFLKVIAGIKKDIPNIKAAIAGKGPEEKSLKTMIQDLNLENNVSMLGFVDNIEEFYNSSRVFLLTSHTEGLPRTILEAMACEIPCVASKVGDMEDIIENKNNGFLVEDAMDIEDYTNKVKILLEDKNLYDTLSKKARFKIIEDYSYASASETWNKIINSLEKN